MRDHWSASQFMLWEQCPASWKSRYVDGEALEVTEAMAFGSAVHLGLEAHYRGADGEQVFRHAWKDFGSSDKSLTAMGLDLLDAVFALDLHGQPEEPFELDTAQELGCPVVGAIDLVGADGVTYDFKTTRGAWSQARAQTEMWQPVLYTWARWDREPQYDAAFEYIVLNRVTGAVDRFRRQWTLQEWVQQASDLWDRMRLIAGDVAAERWACNGSHGYCLECGARWAHDHVCDQATKVRIRRGGTV